ncbi:MAG: aminotransferase class V-fold PLP-dependent enzyme [Microthrixaceae bacterium]
MSDADSFLDSLYPYRRRFQTHRRLPPTGVPRAEILSELEVMASEEDAKGDKGMVSGSIYHGDHDHYHFLTEAFEAFAHANVLQRDMYPSSTKLEGEIVSMTLGMFGGDGAPEACGVLTSGGSESLMTAVYTYREWARETKGITEPEMIWPVTAHCALDKGAHYFGVKVLHAPVTDDFRADVDWIRDHIGPNTIAVAASAGTYPHGVVDPIAEIGAVCADAGIGFHVDGCLGGFILAWASRCGVEVPAFDFGVRGVTSLSADTHKFGYALKGTSVLMYANKELRAHQYFTAGGWPGGIYLSPGMAGSRSGGLIAATWAAMVNLGEQGYLDIAKGIFDTAATLRDGIDAIPELRVLGKPYFLVAFSGALGSDGAPVVDIYHVNDALAKRGWRMNGLQFPDAVHFCITRPNTAPGLIEQFLDDLQESVDDAMKVPEGQAPESGALYGLSGTGPDGVKMVEDMLAGALDAFYAVPDQV